VRTARPATGLNRELATVRDMLDRMVTRRLLHPFSPEEARRFSELAEREVRLLEMLEGPVALPAELVLPRGRR
jgi:hypothetical protein